MSSGLGVSECRGARGDDDDGEGAGLVPDVVSGVESVGGASACLSDPMCMVVCIMIGGWWWLGEG